MSNLVGVSEFVKRQSFESQFTSFKGSWNDLIKLTQHYFLIGDWSPGYRDGVALIHLKTDVTRKFWTYDGFPMFEGMRLAARWEKVPGREHEPAKLKVKILEPKKRCKFVDIVIYRKDVLEEDGDDVSGANWDIVSINGRLKKDPPPIDPMTLVRNWLHLKGGTEMKETNPEDILTMLCDSILYKHGMKKHMSTNKKEKR